MQRRAWLTAFTTALGVVACKHEAPPDPALSVREVTPTVTPMVASAPAPSASSTITDDRDANTKDSSVVDASPHSGLSGIANAQTTFDGGVSGLGRLQISNACGAVANPSCGALAPTQQPPRANVAVVINNGQGTDEQVVRKHVYTLRACANKGLLMDPFMAGTVTLHITVDANGVATVTADPPAGLSPPVVSCMTNALHNVEFDKGAARSFLVRVTQTIQTP
jgi:autotransporter translocation and assembly factor TamB